MNTNEHEFIRKIFIWLSFLLVWILGRLGILRLWRYWNVAHDSDNRAAYLDPMVQGAGRSGIDAMIDGVQKQFAGLKFRRTGTVDAHHDCLRFRWELAPAQGPAIAGGTDFGVARDGLLQKVTGFIDFAPQLAPEEKQ